MIGARVQRSEVDMAVEEILPKVVLVSAFFSTLFVLVFAISPVIIEAERPLMTAGTPPNIMDALMDEYLIGWTPTAFGMDSSYASEIWHPKSTPTVEFTSGGGEEHPLKCWLVRHDPFKPETADYLVFQQIYGWLGTKELHTMVSYNFILQQYDEVQNYSRFTLDLRYTFEVFVWTGDSPGLFQDIWGDHYNMTIGAGLNDSLDSISPWGMVGKIMTFRMPGSNWIVNMIIATPIYLMLIFMGWFIIRSAIPFLG